MRKFGLLFLLSNVVWFAACGGSGSSTSSVTGVMVSCSPSTVMSGGTSQCTATVTGTGNFNTAVTWSATGGTISSSGLLTAPTVSASLLDVVTATSVQNTSVSGSANVTVNPTGPTANNVAPIIVDAGPQGGEINLAYVTVTVCVPGSQTCQNIDHVQVETGSEGLRLVSGVLTVNLPQSTVSGNPLDECLVFADGYVWGLVVNADVTVAGEKASNVPVHVLIPQSQSPGPPSTCSSQSPPGGNGDEGGSVGTLGANGILGVGPFRNDCGTYCQQSGANCNGTGQAPCVYYECPASGCSPANVPVAQQVPNPVMMFSSDNNGVLVQLPSVPNGGQANVPGSLIFGIGTQSNNGLSLAANVYPVPNSGNNAGNIITTFNGQSYPNSFLDSGSNALFFLDSSVSGIATCTGFMNASFWYCPSSSPDNLTASNQGQNNGGPTGPSVPVNFSVEDANTLFNTNNTAFSTLAGPIASPCGGNNNPTCAFDFGLPFFFGKNVFTAIDGQNVTGQTTPFFAY